jgi:hypothetical protein
LSAAKSGLTRNRGIARCTAGEMSPMVKEASSAFGDLARHPGFRCAQSGLLDFSEI